MCKKIRFHVYHNFSRCIFHGRRPYHKRKTRSLRYTETSSTRTAKLYTRKVLVLLETSITQFNEKNYTPAIQKLAFHLPNVCILGTHHRGKEHHETFK